MNEIKWESEAPFDYNRQNDYTLNFMYAMNGTIWIAFPPEQPINVSCPKQPINVSRPEQLINVSRPEQLINVSRPEQLINVSRPEQLINVSRPEQPIFLSANEDYTTIEQFLSDAGDIINITEGLHLPYIITLSKNKKLRLLEGIYQGPIDLRNMDNLSIEGVPEATIRGVPEYVILDGQNSNNINISNLTFNGSNGGIFLLNCEKFNLSRIKLSNFGEQVAISLCHSNNNSIKNAWIFSEDYHSTGMYLNDSILNTISNNSIQVRNALFILQNNSSNNTIYDGNTGNISDNGEKFNETDGGYCWNGNCRIEKRSRANNTWLRGNIN